MLNNELRYNGYLNLCSVFNQILGNIHIHVINHFLFQLFAFDLSPGGTGRGALSLIKQGNLSVSLKFEQPLDTTVMCICMLYFDTCLEINAFRQLITDFSA